MRGDAGIEIVVAPSTLRKFFKVKTVDEAGLDDVQKMVSTIEGRRTVGKVMSLLWRIPIFAQMVRGVPVENAARKEIRNIDLRRLGSDYLQRY